jgi:cobalt-zinc-cadmium efflux system outer membrane protein
VAAPLRVRAQADTPVVTFDEALALGAGVPAAVGPARALEARGEGELSAPATTSQPQLTVYPGYRWQPDSDRGLDLQVTLSQSWSIAGLAGARREAARRERETLGVEARARQLAHRLEAAHAWILRRTLERRLEVVEQEVEAARGLLDAVREARVAGERTRLDQARAEAYLAEVRLHAVDLEGAAFDAGLVLSLRLGRDDGVPVQTAGRPPSPGLPDAALRRVLEDRVAALPGVRALRLAALAARARGAEQRAANAGGTVTVGASYQREAPDANIGFLVTGVTLPVLDVAARAEAEAASEAALRTAEAAQARLEARMHLAEAWHEVEHTREVEQTIRSDFLPPLEARVDLQTALLRAGEGTLWPLLDARHRLAEARDRLVVAVGDRVWAEVRAWLLYAELAR